MSDKPNDGGPAFPNITPDMIVPGGPGMSLRDWFAGMAPPVPAVAAEGYLRCLKTNDAEAMEIPWNDFVLAQLARQEARWRGHFADAMLAERDKEAGPE